MFVHIRIESQNQRIDAGTQQCLERFAAGDREAISRHIETLDREWDVERYLQMNAGLVSLSGVVLGALVSRRFLVCPPPCSASSSNTLHKAGVRHCRFFAAWACAPRREINEEKYALKALRGDFEQRVVREAGRSGGTMMRILFGAPALFVVVVTAACGGGNTPPQGAKRHQVPIGRPRRPRSRPVRTCCRRKRPSRKSRCTSNGFHVSKDDPKMQMEAHHYCNQANEDIAQCVLFDGNTAEARLMGIEYIISEKLYNTLPTEEKAYWHPHNYEVLSGQLRMPGLPDAAEKEALKGKINSYGKTWHTWMTGMHETSRLTRCRSGRLTCSGVSISDGEANPELVQARDRRMELDSMTAETQDRQDLVSLAKPQGGVDAMAECFPNAKPVDGVRDNGDTATRPVPTFSMKGGQAKPSGQ